MDLTKKLSVTQPATEIITLYKPRAITTEISAAYHPTCRKLVRPSPQPYNIFNITLLSLPGKVG